MDQNLKNSLKHFFPQQIFLIFAMICLWIHRVSKNRIWVSTHNHYLKVITGSVHNPKFFLVSKPSIHIVSRFFSRYPKKYLDLVASEEHVFATLERKTMNY